LVYRLAWDLDSVVVEADSDVGGVGDTSGSVGDSMGGGLGNGGGGDGVGQGEGVDSADNRGHPVTGVDSVDKWGVDSHFVDCWESVVNIWGGQTSGIDQGGVSLRLSLSLGNSGGGSWDSGGDR